MFASAPLAHRSPGAFAGAYRKIGVETGVPAASPHQLVTMLFDGFNESVAQAKRAMLFKDIEGKCNAITRAAHQAPTERSWADDEVEEQAAERLYQRVHVLAGIPDEDRAELGWS